METAQCINSLCLVPATTWAQVDPLKPKPFLHQQSNHKVVYSLKIRSELSKLPIVSTSIESPVGVSFLHQ
jgi:hypothetical protein